MIEPNKALEAVGAKPEHLSEGQGLEGAPVLPQVVSQRPAAKSEGLDEELGPDGKPVEKAALEAAAVVEQVVLTEYVSLDDEAGQAAIELLKESGVSPTEANAIFAKAIASGDLKDIDVAALEAKLGKSKATLVMSGVTSFYNNQTAENVATTKTVLDIVGGETNWVAIREWAQAKEKVDPAFASELNTARGLLDAKGASAGMAARELLRLYTADGTTKGLGNTKLVAGNNLAPNNGTNLTRAEYVTAMKKAHTDGAPQATIAALQSRRLAGQAAGI